MSGPVVLETPPSGAAAPDDVRLSLRDRAESGSGFVDGAWWPRSRDLAVELPTLLAEVGKRAGRVERVAFGLSGWDAVDVRRLATRDGRIPLEGFRSIEEATVWLVVRGAGRSRVGLMVIPPDTDPDRAAELLERAGTAGERRSPSELLAAGSGA
jgi:hypothetical protein